MRLTTAFLSAIAAAGIATQVQAQTPEFSGYYRLQTLFQAPENKCFEGNRFAAGSTLGGAAFMDNCQNVSGQYWKFEPAGNGYFKMKTLFLEPENKCLEGNKVAPGSTLGGAAFMADCGNFSGQMWKLVSVGNGYYRLKTMFLEPENKCLEGNRFAPDSFLKGAAFMADCQNVTGQFWKIESRNFVPSPTLPKDVTVGTSPYPKVSLYDLAEFAWKQFVALNYPADPNHRGQPLAGSSLGDPADARVWETYWHRVEIFPGNESPVQSNGKAVVTGKPKYAYTAFPLDGTSFGGGAPGMVSDLWNNLDEDNELNVDEMYARVSANPADPANPNGFTDENRILYEAKMNEEGFNYILANKLYHSATRDALVKATMMPQNLAAFAGTCNKAPASIVSLPCGTDRAGDGNVEIKAAWRKLDDTETDSGSYYTNKVIRYQSVNGQNKWFTDVYGLIGLHIIHKTVNFPTYVFATFEHEDNIASGIGYLDEITQTGRGAGDVAGAKVIITKRDNPIPSDVATVNAKVQAAIKGTVWANYQLVGVQAYPVDFSTITASSSQADISTYYLANIVIESNEELQNFRGGKSGGAKDMKNTYVHGSGQVNMGGCLGCHGVAQLSGSDFNFLIKNGPFTAPEVVGANIGIIDFINIQTYADVQKMFNSYVDLNSLSINSAPHGPFWRNMSYSDFTTGDIPIVPGNIKIVECGDAANSNLVKVLSGSIHGTGFDVPEMPAGGPYFPEEQIESFAAWVQNGCPEN